MSNQTRKRGPDALSQSLTHPAVPRNERVSRRRLGISNVPSVSNSDTSADQPDEIKPSLVDADLQYGMFFLWIFYMLLK
jgi:hypothetical protein